MSDAAHFSCAFGLFVYISYEVFVEISAYFQLRYTTHRVYLLKKLFKNFASMFTRETGLFFSCKTSIWFWYQSNSDL